MAEEKKGGFFSRLVSGLTKTRDNIVSGMDSIFHGFTHIDDDFYEELEEVMIMGDLGVQATYDILDDLKEKSVTSKNRQTAEKFLLRVSKNRWMLVRLLMNLKTRLLL